MQKSIPALVILFLCISLITPAERSKGKLTEFFNALFSTQDLETFDILECFSEKSAESFFSFLDDVSTSLEPFQRGDYATFDDIYWRLYSNQLDFIDSLECAYEFPETKIFLKLIGHEEDLDDSFETFKERFELFYLGNPIKLNQYLKIVEAYLQSNDPMNAGLYLGDLVHELYMYTNPRTNALISWFNGIFKALNLLPPITLHQCLNSELDHRDNINNLYYFYYLWAGVASRALPAFSLETSLEYLTEATKNFKTLFQSAVWRCIHEGPDSARMKRLLGFNLNPYDAGFGTMLKDYLRDNYKNSWTYQTVMGGLEADWKNGYYFQNGEDFAKFLMDAGKAYSGFGRKNLTLTV